MKGWGGGARKEDTGLEGEIFCGAGLFFGALSNLTALGAKDKKKRGSRLIGSEVREGVKRPEDWGRTQTEHIQRANASRLSRNGRHVIVVQLPRERVMSPTSSPRLSGRVSHCC